MIYNNLYTPSDERERICERGERGRREREGTGGGRERGREEGRESERERERVRVRKSDGEHGERERGREGEEKKTATDRATG